MHANHHIHRGQLRQWADQRGVAEPTPVALDGAASGVSQAAGGSVQAAPGRLAENGAAGNIGTAVHAAAGTMLTAITQASRPWSNRFP